MAEQIKTKREYTTPIQSTNDLIEIFNEALRYQDEGRKGEGEGFFIKKVLDDPTFQANRERRWLKE